MTQPLDPVSIEVDPLDLRADAESIVKSHAMIAMAGGLVPVPLVDVALLVGNQVKMVHGLCQLYDVPFVQERARSAVLSLVAGASPVAGVLGLSALKVIPGVGSLVGSGGVSVAGGALTYAVGRVFIHHFETGGDFLNFDAKALRGLLKREAKQAGESLNTPTTGDNPATAATVPADAPAPAAAPVPAEGIDEALAQTPPRSVDGTGRTAGEP